MQLTVCGVHGLPAVEVVVLENKSEGKLFLNNMVVRLVQGHLYRSVTQDNHRVRLLFKLQIAMYVYTVYISGVLTVNGSVIDVDEGKETVLSCQASQFSGLSDPIMFGWFKVQKGLPVSITSRVGNISGLSEGRTHFIDKLTFGNTKRGDAGDYKCKAYNRYGTSTLSAAATIVVKCECATYVRQTSAVSHNVYCLLISP